MKDRIGGPTSYPLDVQPTPAEPVTRVSVSDVPELPLSRKPWDYRDGPVRGAASGSFSHANYSLRQRRTGLLSATGEVVHGLVNNEASLSKRQEFIRDALAVGTLLTVGGALIWAAKDAMDRPSPYQQYPKPIVSPTPHATETPVVLNNKNQPVVFTVNGRTVNS